MEAFSNDKINDNPQYKFVHAYAPHAPYFFDELGNKINSSEYHDIRHFFTYTKYIDKKIIQLIDKIKSKMKKNSIIIIHSDHPGIGAFNILCAIYFPNYNDHKCIPEDGTLVNLFRYLFNNLFATDYKILDNEFYARKNFVPIKLDNPNQLRNDIV